MSFKESFRIATSRPVVVRSLLISLIVGTILIAINHGTGILRGEFDSTCMLRCGLTLVVPYCVSTVSSVLALGR